MNKLKMLAVAAMIIMPMSAMAVDFGDNFELNTTFNSKYSVETSEFDTLLDSEARWNLTADLAVYTNAFFELNDEVVFDRLETGLEYNPAALDIFQFNAYIVSDHDFEYSDAIIEVEVEF